MRWTVGTKLSLAFAVLLLIVAATGVERLQRDAIVAEHVADIYGKGVVATQEFDRVALLIQRSRARMFQHIATTDPRTMADLERDMAADEKDLDAALDRAEASFDDAARKQEIATLRRDFDAFISKRNDVVLPASRAVDTKSALEAMQTETGPPFQAVMAAVERIARATVQRSAALEAEATRALRQGRVVSGVSFAVLTFTCLVIGLALSRNVSRRIAAVAVVTRRVARGEEGARAPTDGDDEIGQLAIDVNAMTDDLTRRIAEQKATAAEEARLREELADAVATYSAFVERVAKGDLRGSVLETGSREMRVLGANLSTMGRALRDMTLRVNETVASLTAATSEISATTQEQSVSTAETASAVAETMSTVEEVTQSAQQGAERARVVATEAKNSLSASRAGREAVERTVAAMGDVKDQVAAIAERMLSLSEQAQAIGQIIGTVNELAEQSNLLALNAAIEAARAGEHGKGFAVVAHEMRALAEQSKRATTEIRAMLSEVQRSTSAAVLATENGGKAAAAAAARARDAGERIEQLAEVIESSFGAAELIVGAAEQQVTGVGQIARAMHSIDRASTQALDGTRQTEGAAKDLNQLALRLRDVVAQYSL